MTIQEGNKLIAEFMGAEVTQPYSVVKEDDQDGLHFTYPHHYKHEIGNSRHHSSSGIKYHCSWDWLMPVWFKILNWNKSEFGVYYTQEISQDFILFKDKNDRGFKFMHLFLPKEIIETPIIPIWESIVQFIQWYNQNKQQ